MSLPDEFYWIPANSIFAVHYPDSVGNNARGCFPYEQTNTGGATENVTVFETYGTRRLKDGGWNRGKIITFQSDEHLNYMKAVSIHFEICSGK